MAEADADFFYDLGMKTVSNTWFAHQRCKRTQHERFHAFFGASPYVCSLIWAYLKQTNNLDHYCLPKHLMWCLLFLKSYATESIIAVTVQADEKTVRKWVWYLITELGDLYDDLIKWDNRFIGHQGGACMVTVDGTDFSIYEPKPWNKKWFSVKHNGAGLRYEVAICIQTGWIVWTNGPFPCGACHDITIFRSGLKPLLLLWEQVEADDGYVGDLKIRTKQEVGVSVRQYIAKSRARARHETINGLFKVFGILSNRFRHEIEKHGCVFRAVSTITQVKIMYEKPTHDVHYPAAGNFY